jgi:segregation and condensation protein B
LYATTKAFLDDLGLRSLQELPPLEEISKSLDAGPALVVTEPPAAEQPHPAHQPGPSETVGASALDVGTDSAAEPGDDVHRSAA